MSLLAELLENHPQRSTAAKVANLANPERPSVKDSQDSQDSQVGSSRGGVSGALTKAERRAVVDAYRELARTLAECPDCPRAVRTVKQPDTAAHVLLAVAVRGVGFCTLRVPRERYAGFKVLEMLERRSAKAVA